MATIEENAKKILEFLSGAPVDRYGRGGKLTGAELGHGTGLPVDDFNLAVELLGERRQIRIYEEAGSSPYSFTAVELTAAGREAADPTVKRDAGLILAFVCDHLSAVSGAKLEAGTGLTAARINHGVDYLDWRGYLQRIRALGTAPYTFKSVQATDSGRRKDDLSLPSRRVEVVSVRR